MSPPRVKSERKEYWTKENVAKAVTKAFNDGLDAAIAIAVEATPRAHTYGSENAEVYRAWDAGAKTAIDAIRSLKKGAAK
jgi:hypothetical protein